MSRAYKIKNKEGIYFVSFATVGWIDVFTRRIYKDILIDSLKYCQEEKGLILFAWCIMSNHVHLIAKAKEGFELSGILRDLKKFTSKKIIEAINENVQESRKEWMLSMFKNAGAYNVNNKNYQFWKQDNKPIELWSNEVLDQKLDYVHNNPIEEGIVEKPEDYIYSSARDYAGVRGLLQIELMI
jgi:REP element-mobilizing transposase RayT